VIQKAKPAAGSTAPLANLSSMTSILEAQRRQRLSDPAHAASIGMPATIPPTQNTSDLLGVEDLVAGSMGNFVVTPELGYFPASHCCAQYTWNWR